jgi:hypothetical protein
MPARSVVCALALCALVTGCGGDEPANPGPAAPNATLTTTTPGQAAPAATPRPPGSRAATGSRLARRIEAACRAQRPPRAPASARGLTKRRALRAAARIDRLVTRLSALRPPKQAMVQFGQLTSTYRRLADLYRVPATSSLAVDAVRTQLLPTLRATDVQARGMAIQLGATGCARPRGA